VVRLQGVCPGDIVVRSKGGPKVVDVGGERLVVLGVGELLVLGNLGLDALLPLGLDKALGLLESRRTVSLCILPARGNNPIVNDVVIRPHELDVRRRVYVVVRLEMGGDGVLELKVRLANARCASITGVKSSGTSEQYCHDGVPGQQPVASNGS